MSDDQSRLILEQLELIKKGLPNGELKRIDSNVKKLHQDVSDLKKMLLDPNDGVIVQTNKNTEFRKEREAKIAFYDEQVHQLDKIKDWKDNVTKALWVGFSALLGIILKIIADVLK